MTTLQELKDSFRKNQEECHELMQYKLYRQLILIFCLSSLILLLELQVCIYYNVSEKISELLLIGPSLMLFFLYFIIRKVENEYSDGKEGGL